MPIPDASPALVGLLDVRGLVVPAIDLRTLLGLERREYTLDTPMIFCRVHGQVVCLVVDAVEDVVEVPTGCMQPPTSLYALADKMLGVCRLAQGLVMMFDLERLVPDEALAAAVVAGGE
jgi:purine-binding chemotaxis protein CheW